MVDVIFNQSAFYSMQASQHILEHISREQITPLLFRLGLEVGDISGDILGVSRRDALAQCLRHQFSSAEELEEYVDAMIVEAKDSLCILLDRARQGEKVRFWYSDLPDEICGTFWLTAQILEMNKPYGLVSEIKFPKYMINFEGSVNSWGEAPPDKLSFFLSREQLVSSSTQHIYASIWKRLQQENGELRAVLNGSLLSVPASLYDFLIEEEIQRVDAKFQEGDIIAAVINRSGFCLGISHVASCIERLIAAGKLEVVASSHSRAESFQRILRKCGK